MAVACGIIWHKDRVLLAQRGDGWGWELPGGKIEPGEDPAGCLRREVAEELGTAVEVLRPYHAVRHQGPPRAIELLALICRLAGPAPRAREHLALAWPRLPELPGFALLPADRLLVARFAAEPPLPAAP